MFLFVFVLAVSAFAACVIYSLKVYTKNNTWTDLELEVHTNAQGTSGRKIEKQEELTVKASYYR